jgi:hypothetical protein
MKRPGAGELIASKQWFVLVLLMGLLALAVNSPVVRAASGAGRVIQESSETQASDVGTPEVTAVDPPGAVRGSTLLVKVTGRNFGKGAKISFANSDIRVMETNDLSSTELTARIQVAPKAATGTTSLYVTNPNYRQTELPFQVAEAGIPRTTTPPATPTTAGGTTTPGELRFEVVHIAGKKILTPGKIKGVLTWSKGKLRLEESGQEVFTLTPAEIKEVEMNMWLGVSTNSFHIILTSGKKYDFWAASLKPAETKFIADSLKRALQ